MRHTYAEANPQLFAAAFFFAPLISSIIPRCVGARTRNCFVGLEPGYWVREACAFDRCHRARICSHSSQRGTEERQFALPELPSSVPEAWARFIFTPRAPSQIRDECPARASVR